MELSKEWNDKIADDARMEATGCNGMDEKAVARQSYTNGATEYIQ